MDTALRALPAEWHAEMARRSEAIFEDLTRGRPDLAGAFRAFDAKVGGGALWGDLVRAAGDEAALRASRGGWLYRLCEGAAILVVTWDPRTAGNRDRHRRMTHDLAAKLPDVRNLLGTENLGGTAFFKIVEAAEAYWRDDLLGARAAGRG
jgi:hypothetical protein